MINSFNKVFPFTTENIGGYIEDLKVENKSVLTVGSSIDQALNSLLFGADRVILYDINPNTYQFLQTKKDIILNTSRNNLYDRIISATKSPAEELFSWADLQQMSPYLKDDTNYSKLQRLLSQKEIEFVEGDIFRMNESLKDEKVDRMIFSNILQEVDKLAKIYGYEGKTNEFLYDTFIDWLSHLNENGKIMLMYFYGLNVNIKNYIELEKALVEYPLILRPIKNNDGYVVYEKSKWR